MPCKTITNKPIRCKQTKWLFFLIISIQNSIRHNLSLHNRFMRVQNEGTGKSSWWMLNPDAKPGNDIQYWSDTHFLKDIACEMALRQLTNKAALSRTQIRSKQIVFRSSRFFFLDIHYAVPMIRTIYSFCVHFKCSHVCLLLRIALLIIFINTRAINMGK